MALTMELKADFHMHTKDDLQDRFIRHSAKELIDHAASLGFEVLSITAHDKIEYSPDLHHYAADKGILLIPGVEVTVEGRHILLINYSGTVDFKKIADLKQIRSPEILILAAHPFYPGLVTLKQKLIQNIDLFDGIEYCHFYHRFLNFNKRAVAVAQQYQKPLVGTSDTHLLSQMGHTYSILTVTRKTAVGVVEAIKKGAVRVVTKPLTFWEMIKILSKFRIDIFRSL